MKVSRYNYFKPWYDGQYIAYNAQSGGMALMTEGNYAVYQEVVKKIESGNIDNFSPEEATLCQQLQHGSFVYDGDYNEVENIHFKHNMARYDRTSLTLAFAPTMACNMACRYCYEANKKGRMSAETVEKIISFVEEQAPGLKQLDITWFGGEPLLAMDIMEDLTKSFLDIQRERKFTYTAMIVTNGHLLTRENVDRLYDLKVLSAQVTLDGPARIHDANRPLKNGAGSFRTIVDNLKYAATKLRTSIRVNVDKNTSVEIIEELLQELDQAGLREIVGINFGRIEALTSTCSNIAETCYDIAEFSRAEVDFFRLMLENGFLIAKLPMPSAIVCIAQNVNSFLIDPEGRLFKCFAQLGDPSKSMGYIGEKIRYSNRNFADLFQFDPFVDEECRQCSILPVCRGGCPEKRTNPGFKKEECCSSWKHNLEPMIDIISHSKLQVNNPVGGN